MKTEKIFPGVYLLNKKLATKNIISGNPVYGEKIIRTDLGEMRFWNPHRSKLGAAIKKGLKTFPFKNGIKVLYLGIATGTTASHISDIIGVDGVIYGIEFAPVSMRDLIPVCEKRENIIPILADARHTGEYKDIGKVDVIFEDVAQPDQAEILIKNADMFLKKGGYVMIAVKSQSIDVSKEPQDVYIEVMEKLKKHFEIIESFVLDPYEKEHLFIVGRK